MKKKKIILIFIMIFFIQFSFCSCLDKKEVNELAIVRGMAIDKYDDFGGIRVSVTIANFSGAKPDTSSGSSQVNSYILTAIGNNLPDAIDKLEDISSKRLILSHNKILILGRTYAESGISNMMDTIERNHFFRNTMFIAVSNTSGYDILKTTISSDTKKVSSIDEFARILTLKTIVYPREWYSFLLNIKSDSGAATAPLIKLTETGIMIENSVVFNNEKMVGILSQQQASILQWLLNNIKDELVVVPYNKDNSVSLFFHKGKSEILPMRTKDGFKVNIKCTGDCEIRGSTSSRFKADDLEVLKEIQISAENYLKNNMAELIKFAQHSLDTDFVGFGNKILNNLTASSKNIDWEEEFPKVQYDIEFDIKIKEIGIIKNSIQK